MITAGTVDEFDTNKLSFTLTPSQYINLTRTILDCHLSYYFDPESKKWQNKKPMPTTGSTISVEGILTNVKRGFNHRLTFEVEIDNIAYFNRSSETSSSGSRCKSMFSPIPILSLISHLNFKTPLLHLLLHVTDLITTPPPKQCSPISSGKRKDNPDPDREDVKHSHTSSLTKKRRLKFCYIISNFFTFRIQKKKKNSQYIHLCFQIFKI